MDKLLSLLDIFRRVTPQRLREEHLYHARIQLLEAEHHVEDWQAVVEASRRRIRRLEQSDAIVISSVTQLYRGKE
jgi:hypothetical protein